MRYRISYLMDEIWERAVETALDGQTDPLAIKTLTLDGAVKCVQGRLPPPNLLERFRNLEHLSIANIGVSSLEQFPRLGSLQKLILSDNRIAGGLEFLVQAGLESLRDLDLSNNRIQFIEDLMPLAELKLVSLDLYECPVTRVKDYRSRVFGLIKSLKYLDKMDAEENERPESDDEEEEDDDEEEDEEDEDDPGSCEINGEERPYRMSNGHSERMEGVLEVDEEEESDADEEETEIGRQINGVGHQANGFRVEAVDAEHEGDGDDDNGEDESGEEDVGEEREGDDDDVDDVVEVHEIEDSDDEDEGVDDDVDEDEDDDEDEEEVDNDEVDFEEPESTGRLTSTEGEIDGHEQGEDDGEDDGVEDDGDFENEDEDEEEDEDYGEGYLVQPVAQGHGIRVTDMDQAHEEDEDGEGEEQVEDDDNEVEVVLPSSSSHHKRKRSGDDDDSEDDDDVVDDSKSSKKHL